MRSLDEVLDERLRERVVSGLNRLDDDQFKDLVVNVLENMGLEVTAAVISEDAARIEATGAEGSYLVAASQRKDASSIGALRRLREKADFVERLPVLVITHEMDETSRFFADENDIAYADLPKLILLIRKFGMEDSVLHEVDRHILEEEGGQFLPSIGRFDSLIRGADKDYRDGKYRDALEKLERAMELKSNQDSVWRKRAKVQHAMGDTDLAIRSSERASELDPRNANNWYLLALMRHEGGDLEEEIAAYDAALRESPRMVGALLNKGATLFEMGRLDDALANFDRMIQLYPRDPRGLNNRALVRKAMGQPDKALVDLDKALAIDPENRDALQNRASIIAEGGEPEKTIEAWRDILALDRSQPLVWMEVGKAQMEAGFFEEAARSFAVANSLDPGVEEASELRDRALEAAGIGDWALGGEDPICLRYIDASLLLEALGDLEGAVGEVEKCLELDPSNRNALLRRGHLLLEKGNMEEALASVGDSGRRDPSPESLLDLEALMHRMGRLDEASSILDRLDNPEARRRRCLIHMERMEFSRSLECIKRLGEGDLEELISALALLGSARYEYSLLNIDRQLQRYPRSPLHLNARGTVLRMIGELDAAEETFREVVEIDPGYSDAWNNLGCVLYLKGEHQDAEKCLREAILVRSIPLYLTNLGICLLAMDNLDEARDTFLSALRLDQSPEAINGMGIVSERGKELVRAMEFYQAALDRAPGFKDARMNRDRVAKLLKE